MFRTLLRKELLESWRSWRLGILLAVFFITGAISPVLAKYTPALLASIPDLPPGMVDMIPAPTIADAVIQYVKNMSQFGVLLIVILSMGSVAQEKERGTAAMLFARPVRRSVMVLSKWLAWVIVIIVSLIPGVLICIGYTLFLFGWLPVAQFLALNGLLVLFFAVYLSVALLASALARTQGMAAGLAFGGLALLLIFSSLPRIGAYFPGQLLVWGQALTNGEQSDSWLALWVSLIVCAAALILACARLEKEEI